MRATTSSRVELLGGRPHRPPSLALSVPSEVVAELVAHAHQVELHRESLLEAIAGVDVDRVDAVERLLGGADDAAVLGGDLRGQAQRQLVELRAWSDLEHRAVLHQVDGRDGPGGEVEGAHEVLGNQPRQVRRRTERALVDLGDAEVGVVTGDHDVRVADQADAAAEAEALHRGDHRDGALVDRLEGGVAALVRADQGVETGGVLHLLDVDARVEALALGTEHDDLGGRVGSGGVQGGGQVEPTLHGERIDRRVVHGDDTDAVVAEVRTDAHGYLPNVCLVA